MGALTSPLQPPPLLGTGGQCDRVTGQWGPQTCTPGTGGTGNVSPSPPPAAPHLGDTPDTPFVTLGCPSVGGRGVWWHHRTPSLCSPWGGTCAFCHFHPPICHQCPKAGGGPHPTGRWGVTAFLGSPLAISSPSQVPEDAAPPCTAPTTAFPEGTRGNLGTVPMFPSRRTLQVTPRRDCGVMVAPGVSPVGQLGDPRCCGDNFGAGCSFWNL